MSAEGLQGKERSHCPSPQQEGDRGVRKTDSPRPFLHPTEQGSLVKRCIEVSPLQPKEQGSGKAPRKGGRWCEPSHVLGTALQPTSGGLSLQRLEAGFWFPGQRWKSGCSSESAESLPLDHQGPVTRPWPYSFAEMNFHRETESSETRKGFY